MASFKDFKAAAPCIKLLNKRRLVLNNLIGVTDQITRLDKGKPNARRFITLEKEMNKELDDLKKSNAAVVAYCISNEPNILDDEGFKEDQKGYNSEIFQVVQCSDEFRLLLEEKGLVPNFGIPEVPVAPDIQSNVLNVLETLANNQSVMTETQTKMSESFLNRTKSPNISQPTFCLQNTRADFANLKDFKTSFEAYVKKCQD